jgi:hypothetical protein
LTDSQTDIADDPILTAKLRTCIMVSSCPPSSGRFPPGPPG